MTEIFRIIGENLYWIVFVTSLMDHSGVAVPIITSGIYISLGTAKTMILWILINIALIIIDVFLMALGTYLKKSHELPYNRFSLFSSLERKIIGFGERIVTREILLFYFFGKFVPYIGKLLPLFIGYSDGLKKKSILLLLIGNNIYILFFMLLGYVFGSIILKYSGFVAALMFILFVLAYLIIVMINKKKAGQSGSSL